MGPRARGLPAIAAATTTTTTATATAATAAAAASATTAATAFTAAATASTTTTTAAAATIFSLVHAQRAPVEAASVHLLHGGACRLWIRERHEAEATRTTGVTIRDHLCLDNLTEGLECSSEAGIVRVPAEATHKQLA